VTRTRPAGSTTGATISESLESRNGRNRGARPITGYAQARDFSRGGDDPFGPWGQWSPWYSGAYFGFSTYDPWRYGSSRWTWARYSGWYDPFGYPYGGWSPYGYGPFGYDPYGHYYGAYFWGSPYAVGGSSDDDYDDSHLGSVRLKAEPASARVYIDGALAGTVDDFDGLSNHLKLEAGKHQLELRADGYEPYSTEIEVKAGRTRTERAELKRRD
jgi:hypothetical protein